MLQLNKMDSCLGRIVKDELEFSKTLAPILESFKKQKVRGDSSPDVQLKRFVEAFFALTELAVLTQLPQVQFSALLSQRTVSIEQAHLDLVQRRGPQIQLGRTPS